MVFSELLLVGFAAEIGSKLATGKFLHEYVLPPKPQPQAIRVRPPVLTQEQQQRLELARLQAAPMPTAPSKAQRLEALQRDHETRKTQILSESSPLQIKEKQETDRHLAELKARYENSPETKKAREFMADWLWRQEHQKRLEAEESRYEQERTRIANEPTPLIEDAIAKEAYELAARRNKTTRQSVGF